MAMDDLSGDSDKVRSCSDGSGYQVDSRASSWHEDEERWMSDSDSSNMPGLSMHPNLLAFSFPSISGLELIRRES
jgi:hypothetical protein